MGTGPVFLIGQQSCCNSRLVAAPALVDALTGAIYEVGPGAIGKTRDGKTSYALPISRRHLSFLFIPVLISSKHLQEKDTPERLSKLLM